MSERRISELREDDLVARIRARIGAPDDDEVWSGDDAAVLIAPGERLVHTVDALVEGVDFDLAYCSGVDVGWKAVAVNVSDLAAMGATPSHALAALGVRDDMPLEVFDGVLDGLVAAGDRWGVRLVGGDLSSASEIWLSVSLLGAAPTKATLRSGARPDDFIGVTGSLGGAAAGLAVLRRGGPSGPAEERLARRQLRPEARLAAGRELAAGATAMIDVSDGLARDLGRLLRAGDCGCEIASDSIPVDADLVEIGPALGFDPLETALTGGEDYELLLTIGETHWDEAVAAAAGAGVSLSRIGQVTDGESRIDGRALALWEERGWDHLQNR